MRERKNINRRQFLQRTTRIAAGAIALPYVVPATVLGKAGEAAGNRLVMGCIGVGGRGTADMRALILTGGVQVVAVCDVQEQRRRAAKQVVDKQQDNQDCAMYDDFRQVLDRKDIDAVMIAPQDHWHGVIAVAAARAGKDMYCEKPLGVAAAEAKAIRDAVRAHGCVFQTGTQQRSDRNFRFACELALNGYVGKVHTVKVGAPGPSYKRKYAKPTTEEPVPAGLDYDMYLGPAPQKPYNGGRLAWPDWYLIWDYCAGFIVNWGVHHLDIANWGCPEVASAPCELTCKGSYRHDGLTDNINDWQAEFTYGSGLRMTFTDTGNPNKQGCEFVGDKGWVHVNRNGLWCEPESLRRVKIKPDEIHLHESKDHHADFVQAVRSRTEPVSTVEAGYRASTLGLIAEVACRVGRKLKWDPDAALFVGDAEANARLMRPLRAPWHL
jgi:predicted dehydrogenase